MAEQIALPIGGPAPSQRRRIPIITPTMTLVRRKPVAGVSLAILAMFLIVGIGAPWLAPEDPYIPSRDRLESPSLSHLMGTDDLGRDVLSRAMWGARTSVVTGLMVVMISTTCGLLIGGLSGYTGGWFDMIVQRVVEAIQALPGLIIAMVLVTVVGPLTWNNVPITVVIALSVILTPAGARIARASAMGVSNMPYVLAARSIGGGHVEIFLRHVVPNVFAPMLVLATVQLGNVILAEAALSFLGVGTPPPTPSWGAMVSGTARSYIEQAPWLALVPGFGITLSVLAFNFLGDGIRDVVDPRLRGSR